MGRPPLAVGTFGQIRLEALGKHRVQASARFRDADGRRRQVVRTGPTRAQAERRLREALRDRASAGSTPLPADSRLSAMATLWLADVDASDLASGTKRLYRFVAHSYVLPGLGELLLRELTVAAVDRLLTTVTADHGRPRPSPLEACCRASSGSPSATDCCPPTRSATHPPDAPAAASGAPAR